MNDATSVLVLPRRSYRGRVPSRGQANEAALDEALEQLDGNRLSWEVAKLDHDEECALAEEGMASELASWPES